jgi:hypothetical protein
MSLIVASIIGTGHQIEDEDTEKMNSRSHPQEHPQSHLHTRTLTPTHTYPEPLKKIAQISLSFVDYITRQCSHKIYLSPQSKRTDSYLFDVNL